MKYSGGVTVSDTIRTAYGTDEEILNYHLENIGSALRMLQQSLLGRNIADASGLRLHIHLLTDENLCQRKIRSRARRRLGAHLFTLAGLVYGRD